MYFVLLKVNGAAILPASAMFEACSAAANVLTDGQFNNIALHSLTIAEPLIINFRTIQHLFCDVVCTEGQLTLQTASHKHCNALISLLPATVSAKEDSVAGIGRDAIPSVISRETISSDSPLVCYANILHETTTKAPSFVAHPAMVDNSMHLLTAFNPTDSNTKLKVPVAVGSLWCKNNRVSKIKSWCHAVAFSDKENALFNCAVDGGWSLKELQVKEMKRAAENAPTEATNFESMYHTQWQLDDTAVLSTEETSRVADVIAIDVTAGSRNSAALDVAASSLQRLQTALQGIQSNKNPLQYRLSGAPTVNTTVVPVSASLSAATSAGMTIAKAAAMESSTTALSSLKMHYAEPSPTKLQSSSVVDTLGTAIEAGAVGRAKLLTMPCPVSWVNSHLLPMPRGSLGGLKLVPYTQDAPKKGQVQV